MDNADWILGQALFWLLVFAIVLVGLVGIRRAGGVLVAHQAGLVGGRSAAGIERGVEQAAADLATWWGLDGDDVADAVTVEWDGARRSIRVRVQGVMEALLGGLADLGAGSFQRYEDFYPGEPADFE